MKLPKRQFLHLAAAAAALPAVSRIARAQAYPSRPVRIIVGFPPGQSADISARLLGQWLSDRLGQSFVIDNRPGGGGRSDSRSNWLVPTIQCSPIWERISVAPRQHSGINRSLLEEPGPRAPNCRIVQLRKA